MRECMTGGDVSDGPNAVCRGAAELVGDDMALCVKSDAAGVDPAFAGVGVAAYGAEYDLGLQGLVFVRAFGAVVHGRLTRGW